MNTSLTGRAEGVQSVALDRVDKPPSLHTSLPVLRRAPAAVVPTLPVLLAPFRRRLATVVAAARLAAVRRRHTAAARLPLRRRLYLSIYLSICLSGPRRCFGYVVVCPPIHGERERSLRSHSTGRSLLLSCSGRSLLLCRSHACCAGTRQPRHHPRGESAPKGQPDPQIRSERDVGLRRDTGRLHDV